jgi:hypothetical protein
VAGLEMEGSTQEINNNSPIDFEPLCTVAL